VQPSYVEMQLGVIMKDLELCVREWNDVPLARKRVSTLAFYLSGANRP